MTDTLSGDPSALLDTTRAPDRELAVSVAEDLDAVADDWRALEDRALASPYQRFDFIAAWARHAAPAAAIVPRIGVVHDTAGAVVAILPFGVRSGRMVSTGHYLGGSHINLNMPLLEPAFAQSLTQAAVETMLDDYCLMADVDLLVLTFQPESWQGQPHPFAGLQRQASSDNVRCIDIADDYGAYYQAQLSADFRKKLRRKTERFQEAGAALGVRATSPAGIDDMLAAFFEQKAKRLRAMGADDPFAAPGVADFLRDAAVAALGGEGGLELHAVTADGEILAVRGGVRHRDHFSLMVQSFNVEHPLAKYSPGEMLLSSLLEDCGGKGVSHIDFGVGDARYKDTWSNGEMTMFDVTYPVTGLGAASALAARIRTAAVRSIKRNKSLYTRLKAWRAALARI